MGLQENGDHPVARLACVRQQKPDHHILNLAVQILAQLPDDQADKIAVLTCCINLVERFYA